MNKFGVSFGLFLKNFLFSDQKKIIYKYRMEEVTHSGDGKRYG